jgi:transposase
VIDRSKTRDTPRDPVVLIETAVLLARIAADPRLPALARELFAVQGEEYALLAGRLRAIETRLMAWHRNNELSRRLATVPGIGPIGASLLAMKVPDAAAFRCGRDLAAWAGLTPKDHSTAGKQRLGTITRAGDEELRRVLVVGAMAIVQRVKRGQEPGLPWLSGLVARKPAKLAAVALANKNVRIAWRLMVSDQHYDRHRHDAYGAETAAVPTRGSVTPCSPPSRRSLPTAERADSASPRPALTASARSVSATAQVGTKKRSCGRTKKLTKKETKEARSEL